MREYELIIDEALKKGVDPTDTIPTDPSFLWRALGFRIGRRGIEGYEACTDDPLSGSVDMLYSWPFPQFIQGERYNFLIIRDAVVNMEDKFYHITDDYVVTHIFDCDVATFGTGTLTEVADFGEYAFMTNGFIMIYWNTTIDDWHEVIADDDIPMMRTVCNFKGQMIGGCVLSEWYDCDETFYVWSKIGEANFTLNQGNVSGYRRDPYGGEVYHVRRLEDSVIGYSDKGVVLMTPVSDPAPTFRFTELDDIGLINRGAIDGTLSRHVYVGSDLVVREITREGIRELGYYSYISNMDEGDILVRYDKNKKDFYIGDSESTLLLSPYGATESPQHPSAVWYIPTYDDETVMLPNTVADYDPIIATAMLDFGYRGDKTIFSVESNALVLLGVRARVGWMNTMEEWGYSDYVPMNNEGIAAIIAGGGSDFVVELKFNFIYRSIRLSYIKVRYKMTDLRGIRGVYAPPLRGQR